jgi:membrane protein YqaA with SNARE-associated domain
MLWLTTLLIAGLGSVVPFAPIEPFLLGLGLIAPPAMRVPLALVATAAHMAGKALLYLGSNKATHHLSTKRQQAIERARIRLSRHRSYQYLTVFTCAVSGLPPFYAITVAAAIVKLPLAPFIVVGTVGRACRFVALVLAPELFRSAT